jgi:ABC-type nickel/cobalt efflux system permease component RcnA
MPEETETVALLREIRDLQRAHFERYKKSTAAALRRQDEASERQQQFTARTAQARKTDLEYRAVRQQFLAESKRSARQTRVIVWISVVLQFGLVFAPGCIILVLLRR